jgi:hypothetical protein
VWLKEELYFSYGGILDSDKMTCGTQDANDLDTVF